jgi:hypothetical protein
LQETKQEHTNQQSREKRLLGHGRDLPPSQVIFPIGSRVQAKYTCINGFVWLDAIVASVSMVDGSYTLDWEDGDDRDRVKWAHEIRSPLKATCPEFESWSSRDVNSKQNSETCGFRDGSFKSVHIATLAGNTLAQFRVIDGIYDDTIGSIKKVYCNGHDYDQLLLDGDILQNFRRLSEIMGSLEKNQADMLFVRRRKPEIPRRMGGSLSRKLTGDDSD